MRDSLKVLRLLSLSAIFCVLTLFSLPGTASNTVMVIKYPAGGAADKRLGLNYAYELIQLILTQTTAEYGDYRVEPYVAELDEKRQAVLMMQGDLINLSGSSSGTAVARSGSIQIPYDIYRGLLGHRICLTNSDSKTQVNAITDLNSLKKIRIGQSMGWADSEIYNFNKLSLILASTFDGLLAMLAAGRYECLALGVTEIQKIYENSHAQMPKLEIEKNLLIYYEYPFYFYISAKYPEIAERFKMGMKKILDNGEFDRLFSRYFSQNLDSLNIKSRRVICLQSPFMNKKIQCQQAEPINSPDKKPPLHNQQ